MLVTLVLMLEVDVLTIKLTPLQGMVIGGGINDEAGDIKLGNTGVIGGGVIS
jgi:hypothetical protein